MVLRELPRTIDLLYASPSTSTDARSRVQDAWVASTCAHGARARTLMSTVTRSPSEGEAFQIGLAALFSAYSQLIDGVELEQLQGYEGIPQCNPMPLWLMPWTTLLLPDGPWCR
eukprot:1018016-Amphidinium_carterae.1